MEMLANFAELPEISSLSPHATKMLDELVENFSLQRRTRQAHQAGINHDVKLSNISLKNAAGNKELADVSEFIHFGCTSEDINNLAYGLMMQTARKQCILPAR